MLNILTFEQWIWFQYWFGVAIALVAMIVLIRIMYGLCWLMSPRASDNAERTPF